MEVYHRKHGVTGQAQAQEKKRGENMKGKATPKGPKSEKE